MNRAVDSRTDLYSLGVTFYRCSPGACPSRPATPSAGCTATSRASRRRPTRWSVRSSPPWSPTSSSSCSPRCREERYQSARGPRARSRALPAASGASTGRDRALPARRARRRPIASRSRSGSTAASAERAVLHEALRARGRERDARAGAGLGLLGHRQVVAGARAAPADRPQARLLPRGQVRAVQARRPLLHHHPGVPRGRCWTSSPRAPSSVAAWRRRLQAALGPNGQLIVDLIPQVELVIGPQPPVPELPLGEAQNRLRLVLRELRRRVRDAGAPAGPLPRRPAVGGPGQPEARSSGPGHPPEHAAPARHRRLPRQRGRPRPPAHARARRSAQRRRARSATSCWGRSPRRDLRRARRRHAPLLARGGASRSPAWCARRPAATPSSSSSS